jgi:hypothetical protein
MKTLYSRVQSEFHRILIALALPSGETVGVFSIDNRTSLISAIIGIILLSSIQHKTPVSSPPWHAP